MKRVTFLSIKKESEKLYNIRYTIGHGPELEWDSFGEKDPVTKEFKARYKKNLETLIESLK